MLVQRDQYFNEANFSKDSFIFSIGIAYGLPSTYSETLMGLE
jgi:hypothetical protein